ncbi:MAG: nucleoside triphosphate pyrophosphohydrolase [Planctomyces sp.]
MTEADEVFSSERPIPGTPPDVPRVLPEFQRLCEVVARLRAPDGCPWDRQQTLQTIKPYTLEETYELLEAIDADDSAAIQEELGDLLLQVILDAQIAADDGRFELTAVVRQIADKMVRRHPHVFGDGTAATVSQVRAAWQTIKQQEKPARASQLEGIPKALPELARAARLSSRAALVGYDFPDRLMLFEKLREELGELAVELFGTPELPVVIPSAETAAVPDEPWTDAARRERAESELGDVLFAVANIARRWGINPEEALRKTNARFTRRFQAIETAVRESGRTLQQVSLPEMESIYQAYKRREQGRADASADTQ